MRTRQRLQYRANNQKLDEQARSKRTFDWSKIHCRLLWYYEGPPNTQSGTFETVNFIVWQLIRGSVIVEAADNCVQARAGDCMIMSHKLGRRTQVFSSDARIESLHLGIDTQSAEWIGPSIVVMRDDSAFSRAVTELGRYVLAHTRAGLKPGGHVFMCRTFLEQIQMNKQLWCFFGELGPRLTRAGMMIREPEHCEPGVAASMKLIDNWPLNLAWDRRQIARAASVSASQLDRIWREARGETPFQYWNSRRIRFACDRLENSTCCIKEIAFDLGFRHLAQFSTWFHNRMNASPREYRRAFIG